MDASWQKGSNKNLVTNFSFVFHNDSIERSLSQSLRLGLAESAVVLTPKHPTSGQASSFFKFI